MVLRRSLQRSASSLREYRWSHRHILLFGVVLVFVPLLLWLLLSPNHSPFPTEPVELRSTSSVATTTTTSSRSRTGTLPRGSSERFEASEFPSTSKNHADESFLVVMGILSMDDGGGTSATRRAHHRHSWFRYRGVWTYERRYQHSKDDLALLPKFVVARPYNRSLLFSQQLTAEAHQFRDMVALDMWEGDPRGGKQDSGDVGLWSLGADLGMSLKSLLWRLHALGAYRTSFIGKMDDDAFLYVPNYLATLRSLYKPLEAESLFEQPIYWGYLALCRREPKRFETDFLYAYGMLNTVSTSVMDTILARSPELPRALEILNYSSRNPGALQQTAVEAVRLSLDREDFMLGMLIDSIVNWNVLPPSRRTGRSTGAATSPSLGEFPLQRRQRTQRLWLLHDCRFIDTPVLQHHNKTLQLPQSAHNGKSWVVALHKMKPEMYNYTAASGDILQRWPDRDTEDHLAQARAWSWKPFHVTSSRLLEPGGPRSSRVRVWYPAFALHRCPQPIQGCVQGRRKLKSL